MRRRSDMGASALEYIASIVIAAMVAGAVYVAVAGDGRVKNAVCRAVGTLLQDENDCGPVAAEPPTDEDFEPDKCKYNEKGEQFSAKIKIAFIEIGENSGFIVTEYSDGTVTMTATDGASIGATGGLGADASFDKMEAGLKVDFGGGVKFDYGSTWTFDSKAEADAMREQLNQYLTEQYLMSHPDPMGGPVIIWDPTDPPKPPSQTTSSISTYADIALTLGIDLTADNSKGGQNTVPAAQLFGSVSPESKWAVRNDTAKGTTTYTTDLSINTSVGGQVWTKTFGTNEMNGASMSITKDKDGNITNVTFITTNKGAIKDGDKASGSGTDGPKGEDNTNKGGGSVGSSTDNETATVTTTSIDIDPDDPTEQQTVRDWLGGDSNYSTSGAISAGSLNPSVADPNDPFQQLAYEKGKVAAVTYNNVTDQSNFGLNVKVGFALGFDFSLSNSESQAIDASFLGAPDASGVRQSVPYTNCTN